MLNGLLSDVQRDASDYERRWQESRRASADSWSSAPAAKYSIATDEPHALDFSVSADKPFVPTDSQRRGVCFVNVKRNTVPEEEHSFLAEVAPRLGTGRGSNLPRVGRALAQSHEERRPSDTGHSLRQVALRLERRVYAPKERLVPEDLQIVMKGILGQNGNILRQGAVFGLDFILASDTDGASGSISPPHSTSESSAARQKPSTSFSSCSSSPSSASPSIVKQYCI